LGVEVGTREEGVVVRNEQKEKIYLKWKESPLCGRKAPIGGCHLFAFWDMIFHTFLGFLSPSLP